MMVTQQVELHLPDGGNDFTLFRRLDKARKETGAIDPRLLAKSPPPAGELIWSWFWELDAGREETLNGLARISHRQISDWCAITGNVVRDSEVRILLAMDRARREAIEAVEKRSAPATANSRPMTPALFDAIFQ
jgi:hypothetical protein